MDTLKLADTDQQEVAGVLASEDLDRDGEKFDYEASKPYFQKWSQDLYEASKKTALPGEESYGNVRLMHGKTTVGKLVKIVFDDAKKTIWAIAKVTDPKVWDDIRHGVYSAFSIAGKLVKQTFKAGKNWITVQPLEVSIVDYPSNPTTTFDWARGACFAKFADPAYAPDAVPDQGDPSPGEVEQPTLPEDRGNGLPAVRVGEPDTQGDSSRPESADMKATMISNDTAASQDDKSELSDPNVGAKKMAKETEVQKSARKSLHDHFAALKAAATDHVATAQAHEAKIHDLCDKCMKAVGEPSFDADEEREGGQDVSTGDERAATDTTVKNAIAELTKTVTELSAKLNAKEEKKETSKAAEPVVGDPKDAVKTGEEIVTKAAEEKKKAEATNELAKAAFGVDANGNRKQADPKAMNDLYAATTKRFKYVGAKA